VWPSARCCQVGFVESGAVESGDGTIVPVEVWNGTSQTVSGVDISGPAMSGSTVVGSGDSQDVEPGVLAPSEVAFGMVFYSQDCRAERPSI